MEPGIAERAKTHRQMLAGELDLAFAENILEPGIDGAGQFDFRPPLGLR